MEPTDHELLAKFHREKCEQAFRQLVTRHAAMVFAAARRITGDPHGAEEISQAVFLLLARKAGEISSRQPIAGWLYHAARHRSLDFLRSEARRLNREQIVTEMQTQDNETQPSPLSGELEDALDALQPEERDILVIRYLEERQLGEVGHELGISEQAAQKRVSRALEKLRVIFSQRGVTLTSGALVAMLVGEANAVIPAGFISSTAAAAVGAAAATTITHGVSTTMNLLNLKTAAAMLSVAALTGTTTYLVKEREADKLRADYQSLQEGQHKLAKDQQDAASAIRLRDEQIEQLKKDTAELPRLRGELDNLNRLLAKLRMEQAQGKQLGKRTEDEILERKAVDQPSQIKPGTLITKDMLAFAGYETPEDAYQSVIWSMFKGHGHEIGMVDVQRQQAFEKQLQEMEPLYKGLQILARKNIDSDHVELLVRLLLDQDEKALPSFVNQPEISIQAMVRDAGMWRIKAGGNTFPSVSEWQNIGNIIRYAY